VLVVARRRRVQSRSLRHREVRRAIFEDMHRYGSVPPYSMLPTTIEEWREHKLDRLENQPIDPVIMQVLVRPGRYHKALEKVTGVPAPEGLSEAAVRRRRLAERVFVELTHPPYGRKMLGKGNDFVATFAIPTTLDDAPLAREALAQTPALMRNRANVRSDFGEGGDNMLVHGPTFSVVFSVIPLSRSWLCVCVDGLDENFWLLDFDLTEPLIINLIRADEAADIPDNNAHDGPAVDVAAVWARLGDLYTPDAAVPSVPPESARRPE
jgi:hypothetical protein